MAIRKWSYQVKYPHRSVVYVNYSPYENSGKILDYQLEQFKYVFMFSIGFYKLDKKQKYNQLLIYKEGKLVDEHYLRQLPTPPKLVFIMLPIRSVITMLQIIWQTFLLKRHYGPIEIYFTVNAFTGWVGMVMKKLGLVQKTVFWVWDYYPPVHENKIIQLMRWIYWRFDQICSYSDRVIYINRRLLDLRKEIGLIPKDAQFPLIPIGASKTIIIKGPKRGKAVFGFIGVLKKSQGLDMVFNNSKAILQAYPDACFEVIGSGPDDDYFKAKARKAGLPTTFHGYLDGDTFNQVLGKCSIGLATYLPDQSNVSHFGDPGKVKRYLSLGLPSIVTNVFEFSTELEKSGAGVVINYYRPKEFVDAVNKILKNYPQYRRNAIKLNRKFYYRKLYQPMFDL